MPPNVQQVTSWDLPALRYCLKYQVIKALKQQLARNYFRQFFAVRNGRMACLNPIDGTAEAWPLFLMQETGHYWISVVANIYLAQLVTQPFVKWLTSSNAHCMHRVSPAAEAIPKVDIGQIKLTVQKNQAMVYSIHNPNADLGFN